ncbi:Crp/Fnr family transcriptional regulator [Kitasatospora putterlickiae]|uniref:Crp/Fnr family transcriptional regulator n=1 Tax=Kitasatospora putterlickiae TaxID=221725 RepID=A0ABN1YFE1_9ACTN
MVNTPSSVTGRPYRAAGPVTDHGLDDRVPFLARLDHADRIALLALGRRLHYPVRSTVLREGEPSDHVLIVLHGWLKVTAAAENGYEALLALRGPGDIIGESAALSGRPRAATVTALEQVEATVVDRTTFTAYLKRAPMVSMQLLALSTDRLRAADHHRLKFAALSVSERLSDLLLELARTHGRRTEEGIVISVPLSQQELAGSVGASREAVARLLKSLRDRGIVVTSRRSLVIARPDLLRRPGRIS